MIEDRKKFFEIWWRAFAETLKRWHLLAISIVAMIVATIANLAMLYLIGPGLKTLFDPENATLASAMVPAAAEGFAKARLDAIVSPIIFGATQTDTLFRLCVVLFIVVLVQNIFNYIQLVNTMLLLQSITNDFRKSMFGKIVDLPFSFFHTTRTGEIISRITSDVQQMQNSVAVTVVDMIRDPLIIASYYGLLLLIDMKMTLLITIIAPCIILMMSVVGKFLRKYGQRMQQKMAELTSVLQESVSGIRVVKAFGAENFEKRKFSNIADKYLKTLMKSYRIGRLTNPMNELMAVCAACSIMWFGGRRVLASDGLAPSDFVQYIATMLLLMAPIKSFVGKVNKIQEGLAAADRVFSLLDFKPPIPIPTGEIAIDRIHDRIIFDNVSFRYENAEKDALKCLNLEIQVGKVVAIVGHSGSGKSTTADILARFYKPTSGRITIDSVDLLDVQTVSWHSLLGIVSQEVILFNDTVAANIAYADSKPDIVRITEAARGANALDFIEKLPRGFETTIGDRGTQLSGGERQRVAIARAFYRNPQLLILDEATSALDSLSENLVQNAIERLVEGRTVLVIAHRLSTVINADKIVVMANGEKVAEGRHEELLANCSEYRELYNMQYSKNR